MNLKTGPGQKSRRERDWESHNRRQTERNTRTGRFAICRNINVSLRRIASCEVHKDYPDYDEV